MGDGKIRNVPKDALPFRRSMSTGKLPQALITNALTLVALPAGKVNLYSASPGPASFSAAKLTWASIADDALPDANGAAERTTGKGDVESLRKYNKVVPEPLDLSAWISGAPWTFSWLSAGIGADVINK
jgi:hypothetical protein